jgi:DNA-binding transcriptional ArsR family regulator
MNKSQLAHIGALFADPTRAEILTALMDGRAHTGSELARHVGVAPSTTSEHLSRLLDAGMVTVEAQGRHRYYRLASPDVAELLETLGATQAINPPPPPKTPAGLAYARTCYDHLAGELAVAIYNQFHALGHLVEIDHHLQLTDSGIQLLEEIGVDVAAIRASTRPKARACLDWTQRRHHLAGAAGAHLLNTMLTNRWLTRGPRPRSIRVTQTGRQELTKRFQLA